MTDELGRDWLTTDEVAELLGLKPTTVAQASYQARKGGGGMYENFPQPRFQKVTIYSRADIEAYMKSRRKAGRPPKAAGDDGDS
ncbi:helix-turn-helix domain-containing protein [Sinomonas sp. JGH33]|uniref:Helix-turn-helix domain-containing protein n=1 Tax=Sinomonas terricola TaxID=3110330 RepID=A0ABU5TCA2_9MICC|nr:helix-turn-helix domain-containing protein [Sinomonas sp. JGH33]MEA5457320.1 helix-turn-helix domain-containing protein [Sinomonas sp. JGH33]